MEDTALATPAETGRTFWYRRRPAGGMNGLVSDIIGYSENGVRLSGATEMAALVVPLVISFGRPFAIALGRKPVAGDTWTSFAAGLFAGHVVIDSTGGAECIQVDFTPLGARRFFGVPMSELANRMVAIDDLDRELADLRERLGEMRDWPARLDLVEAFVLERLRRGIAPDRAVCHAFRRIVADNGVTRIRDIAREVDWSRKHLANRFKAQIGLSPKAIARMVRFRHVVAQAAPIAHVDWADLAAGSGYADQAHLAREFMTFSGMTPTRWLAAGRLSAR